MDLLLRVVITLPIFGGGGTRIVGGDGLPLRVLRLGGDELYTTSGLFSTGGRRDSKEDSGGGVKGFALRFARKLLIEEVNRVVILLDLDRGGGFRFAANIAVKRVGEADGGVGGVRGVLLNAWLVGR